MTATATWKDVARQQNLIDEALENDPGRMAVFERLLQLLPDDASRVLFLRYAADHGLRPDSPHMVSILLMLGFSSKMIVSEIDTSLTVSADMLKKIEQATQQVASAAVQVLDRSNHLRAHSESMVSKMDALAGTLPDRFQTIVGNLSDLLKAAADAKVNEAIGPRMDSDIKPKMTQLLSELKALEEDCKLIAERLVPIAVQIKDVIAAEPFVLGRIKLNRVTAQVAGVALVIGLVLGTILGLVIPKPTSVVLTPEAIRQFDQGAAYAQLYDHLSPTQRADIGRLLSAPAASPTPR